MFDYGLQIVIGLIIFAIHYTTMIKLTPLTYRPQFRIYSIASHALFLIVLVYGWIWGYSTDLMRLIPIGTYSIIFAPLAGVILFAIYRYLNNPKVDLIPKWKYLMLVCYGAVVITLLYYCYYLFRFIFY